MNIDGLSVPEPWDDERHYRELIDAMITGAVFEAGPALTRTGDTRGALVIPAHDIRHLLRDFVDIVTDHPLALNIRGATISGELNLQDQDIRIPLTLRDCTFEKAALFNHAKIFALNLQGSILPALHMESTITDEPFVLTGATITGDLILTDAIMKYAQMRDINVGRVNASGIIVADNFELSGATIANHTIALDLRDCRADTLDLSNLEASGGVLLENARARTVLLTDAVIIGPHGGPALALDGFDGRLEAEGLLVTGDDRTALDSAAYHFLKDQESRVVGRAAAVSSVVRATLTVLLGLFAAGFLIRTMVELPNQASEPLSVSALGPILLTATICGLLSCSMLEVAKRLLRLRGLYQLLIFKRWLRGKSASRSAAMRAYHEFVRLAGAEGARASYLVLREGASTIADKRDTRRGALQFAAELRLFDLPIEQLAAQFSNAIENVLQDKKGYRSLARVVMGAPEIENEGRRSNPEQDASRATVSVDQMQIAVGSGWRRTLIGASTLLSGLWGLLFTLLYRDNFVVEMLTVVASVFVGGFVAWLIRDIAAGIENWRR